MSEKMIGKRSVGETAEIMKIGKSRVTQIRVNALRKLRWPGVFSVISNFIDEYNEKDK